VPFARIDCTKNEKTCQDHKVDSYPAVILFREGKEPVKFAGTRTATEIVNFVVKKTSSPLIPLLTVEDIDNFIIHEPSIVGFFSSESDPKYAKFEEIASRPEFETSHFSVVIGPSKDTLNRYNISSLPAVKIFRETEVGEDIEFNKNDWDNTLRNWILIAGTPLVDEIGPNNFIRYKTLGNRLVIGFFDRSDEESLAVGLELLKKLAKLSEFSDIKFGWSDGKMYSQQAERFGASGTKYPVYITTLLSKDESLAFDENKFPTFKELKKWITAVNTGDFKSFIRSEPLPIHNDDPVLIAVGKTVRDIISQPKDVLLDIYAPWCGHCNELAPTLEKLAERMEPVDSIVIAKINGDANQYNHIAQGLFEGYPTLIFYPAKHKSNAIKYSGDRSFKDIFSFLKKNADIKFELSGSDKFKKPKDEL